MSGSVPIKRVRGSLAVEQAAGEWRKGYCARLLPPLFELAKDEGPIGQVLHDFANGVMFPYNGDELLREAARRELGGEDPWQFLMRLPGDYRQARNVFRGAQSQRQGWRQLLDTAHRWGTLRDECMKLRSIPSSTPIQPCQRQWFSRAWRVNRWAMLDDPKLDEEMRAELERMGREEEKKLVKRYGREVLKQTSGKPNCDALFEDRLNYLLVRWWVRCGDGGVPGLMFFSGRATAQLLHALLGCAGVWPSYVKRWSKKRQRLGLLLANEDNPYITEIQVNRATELIEGDGRHQFEFRGEVRVCGEVAFPRRERLR